MTNNIIIYIFLFWNSLKLFLISADPIIQLLNLLISTGIYFVIEDDKTVLSLNHKLSSFIGVCGFTLVIVKSFLLNSTLDKYYYFNLPLGILFLIIIFKLPYRKNHFNKIFVLSLLLPVRKLFYEIFINILMPLTKYLTWFVLFSFGKNPVIKDQSLLIGDVKLSITKGCAGVDNLYFVFSLLLIYMFIFRLKSFFNIKFILIFSILTSIFVNVLRNTLLALIVFSNNEFKNRYFYFLHDSYGSLIFIAATVIIVSLAYFKLLDKELKYN